MEYKIDDTKEDWDHNMQDINDRLYQNALRNGITKKEFKFLAFKITDFDEDYQETKDDRRANLIKRYKSSGSSSKP